MAMSNLPVILVVAGSDSSGGAGIVRDIETIAHFGLKTCVAVTAVTAQTDGHVTAVRVMDPELVEAQMSAALSGRKIMAVKIGMLASADIVGRVASFLSGHPDIPVVLDPVIQSTSGTDLLSADGVSALLDRLLPLATVITPNLPELVRLGSARAEDNIEAACAPLLARGTPAVLVKGGHFEGSTASDILLRPGMSPHFYSTTRVAATLRGTGCMLASAIAAGLARGLFLEAAIGEAKAYVTGKFEDAFRKEMSPNAGQASIRSLTGPGESS